MECLSQKRRVSGVNSDYNKMNKGLLFFGLLFFIPLVFAWNFDSDSVTVTTISGNLTNFTGLQDTPSSYSGSADQCVVVNSAGTELAFGDCATSAGDITAVTAGTGLTGGGTSGAVTINLNLTYLNDSIVLIDTNTNESLYNWVVGQGYTSSALAWSDVDNGTFYYKNNPFGFYNITNFDNSSFQVKNNKTLIGNYSASIDFCIAGGKCLSSSGSGNVNSVNERDYFLSINSTTGDVYILFNWTRLNQTINQLENDTTYTAGSNLTLSTNEFSVDVPSLVDYFNSLYQAVGNYLTSAVEKLTSENDYISVNVSTGSVGITFNESRLNNTIDDRASGVETDPLWSGNYSAFNVTWSSTYNVTYDAYNNTGLIKNWSQEIITADGHVNTTLYNWVINHGYVTNLTVNKTVSCSDIIGGSDADYCADADSGSVSGNPFNQDVNTTDNVTFWNVTAFNVKSYFWENVSITTGQVSNFAYNTTEEIQDAVGIGFTGNLSYDDTGNTFDVNSGNLSTWLGDVFQPLGAYLTSAVEKLFTGNDYIILNASSSAVKIIFNETRLNNTIDDRATTPSGSNPFDQSLNSTDNVTFFNVSAQSVRGAELRADDWTNVSITESQISDFGTYRTEDNFTFTSNSEFKENITLEDSLNYTKSGIINYYANGCVDISNATGQFTIC